MKIKSMLTASALSASLLAPVAMAADNTNLSDAQKKEVQKIVHDYLISNPEVLVEASQVLQQRQQQQMEKQAQSAIKDNTAQLFSDNMTTVGNLKGNVTVVEFFDYQCIHCKKMAPVLSTLIQKDKNLRVIYKEFPIFGKSSETASRAALAAGMQGKYLAMHDALFKIDARLTDQLIDNAAKSIGLNLDKLKTDMKSQQVTDALDANRQLAEKLHLMGTPALIVGATPNGVYKSGTEPAFIPGAMTEDALQDLIKKQSAGN